jgi:hypothetical protein
MAVLWRLNRWPQTWERVVAISSKHFFGYQLPAPDPVMSAVRPQTDLLSWTLGSRLAEAVWASSPLAAPRTLHRKASLSAGDRHQNRYHANIGKYFKPEFKRGQRMAADGECENRGFHSIENV